MLDCKYRNIECFEKLSNAFKTKSLSLFHLNICSLQRNFCNFHILLNELNIDLDIATGQIYVRGIFVEHSDYIFSEYSEKVPYEIPGNIPK